jgi:hypothetical protein
MQDGANSERPTLKRIADVQKSSLRANECILRCGNTAALNGIASREPLGGGALSSMSAAGTRVLITVAKAAIPISDFLTATSTF